MEKPTPPHPQRHNMDLLDRRDPVAVARARGKRVLIAGGGIGGLTLALTLHRYGLDCIVFEQSEEMHELGVGINTLPHAIKELAELDLLPALDSVGIRTHELIYLNRFGQEVWREKRGMHAGHSQPQFSIHRGHLRGLLWRAVCERLPPEALRCGHRLAGFEQDGKDVIAYFVDREGRAIASEPGTALIAADGIHSAARAILHPDDPGIRWQGIMTWRGAVEAPSFLDGNSMAIARDMQDKLVLYPIASAAGGRRLTYWAVAIQTGDGRARRRRSATTGAVLARSTRSCQRSGASICLSSMLRHWYARRRNSLNIPCAIEIPCRGGHREG